MSGNPSLLDIADRSQTHDSDWTFHFLLRRKIPFKKLVGSKKIIFKTKLLKGRNYLVGFDIVLKSKKGFDAHFSALETAKRLTDLVSVLSGKHTSAEMNSFEVVTDIGTLPARVMGGHPLKPVQDLELDLSNGKIGNLLWKTSSTNLRIAHLSNALHASYETPSSAIREIVLAYNENLPKGIQHIEVLRHGLSHDALYQQTIKKIEQSMPFKFEFTKGQQLDLVSARSTGILTMETLGLLHNAIESIRKKLVT